MAMNVLDKDTVRVKINAMVDDVTEGMKVSRTAYSQFENSSQTAGSKRLKKISDDFALLVEAMKSAAKAAEDIKEATEKYIKEFDRVSGED